MNTLPLSAVVFSVLFAVTAAASIRTRQAYRGKGGLPLRDMAIFFAAMAIFRFSMTWPHIFWQNPSTFESAMHWSQLVGFIFYQISNFFLASAALRFKWQGARMPILSVLVLLGIFHVAISWLMPNHPTIDPKTHFTVFGDFFLVGIITSLTSWIAYGTLALVFITGLSKMANAMAKKRAVLLSIGSICIMIGGPVHATTNTYVSLAGDALLLIGIILIWGGVFLFNPRSGAESNSTSAISPTPAR